MDHPVITREDANDLAYQFTDSLASEIEKAVIGKSREAKLLIAALIAGGHVLIEDVPGVGKTTLASALAAAAGLTFRRAQFTPDVLPSDITGFNLYNRKTESFEFRRGIVDTHILLADEINRASPKTQSSLLEAMEENKVTVDGTTYPLPKPFMVIATQNPLGFVGTYPLPESQLDRFALRIRLGYPTTEEEIKILTRRMGSEDPLAEIRPLPDPKAIFLLKAIAEKVKLSPEIKQYLVTLVAATRGREELALGASPRASLSLMRLAKAKAVIEHRDYVVPEDVSSLFSAAVAHRVTLSREAAAAGRTAEEILEHIRSVTPVPFLNRLRRPFS